MESEWTRWFKQKQNFKINLKNLIQTQCNFEKIELNWNIPLRDIRSENFSKQNLILKNFLIAIRSIWDQKIVNLNDSLASFGVQKYLYYLKNAQFLRINNSHLVLIIISNEDSINNIEIDFGKKHKLCLNLLYLTQQVS